MWNWSIAAGRSLRRWPTFYFNNAIGKATVERENIELYQSSTTKSISDAWPIYSDVLYLRCPALKWLQQEGVRTALG